MDSAADRLQSALNRSAVRGQHGPLLRLLRRHRRDGLDAEMLRDGLAPRHPDLDRRFLHPQLLPAELLVDPQHWRPDHSGINAAALLASHPELTSADNLVSDGLLNKILKGERALYNDLPALAIDAYATELRRPHRAICRQDQLCALTHLSLHGRDAFRRGEPVAACLDLYQPVTDEHAPKQPQRRPLHEPWLVVMDSDRGLAAQIGRQGGWDRMLAVANDQLPAAFETLRALHPDSAVSFCHGSDRLVAEALDRLSLAWHDQPGVAFCSSDERLAWNPGVPTAIGNPQHRVAATAARVISRGGLGGLMTFRAGVLSDIDCPSSISCCHQLLLDLTLQLIAAGHRGGHCAEVLLIRSQPQNPSLLDIASPLERQCFSTEQIQAINQTVLRRAQPFLNPGGSIQPHPEIAGCQRFRFNPVDPAMVSIIIPFRDQMELTESCLRSIRQHAGDVNYEIVLVNNGSRETTTQAWLNDLRRQAEIKLLDLDIPFNFATLNNAARRLCTGNYLLLLNNDIEFKSDDILQKLLDPFAYQSTAAVGSRLLYPDGEIQHQGVVLITGERRSLLEPGKTLREQAVIDRLTPLRVEESFNATSAACLMIKAELFDAVGGFNEQYAVTFNDVDLCLRLRQCGHEILVTPFPEIIHHEGKSRGKDLDGSAFARQQKEQGFLRRDHADHYSSGDSLTSQKLLPHSRCYEPKSCVLQQRERVQEKIIYSWTRKENHQRTKKPLLFFAQYDPKGRLRDDIIPLLEAYQKHADVVFIAATPELKNNTSVLRQLQRRCAAILIRDNEGYDFGSWMTGLRFFSNEIQNCDEIIITNDSMWGPITNLNKLFNLIRECNADIISLTDDLMYSYHLQSSFLVFRNSVINSEAFQNFWSHQLVWDKKRDLVKSCEVGLSRILIQNGYRLKSLYSDQSNGNILHFRWRELIEEDDFPFLKVSLLRDNPTSQSIDGWERIIQTRNKRLFKLIQAQINDWNSGELSEGH